MPQGQRQGPVTFPPVAGGGTSRPLNLPSLIFQRVLSTFRVPGLVLGPGATGVLVS